METSEVSPVERELCETLSRIKVDKHVCVPDVFADISVDQMAALGNAEKRACWINVYNIGVQYLLRAHNGKLDDPAVFDTSFSFNGQSVSLNDIEHGILRGGRDSDFEYTPTAPVDVCQRLSLDLDPRLHFALNCGARSCPLIEIYRSATLDRQLARATTDYLTAEVTYMEDIDTVVLPELFDWFVADFGGSSGIVELLRTHGIIPDDRTPAFEYQDWDWTAVPRKFR
jgi:hypothetical protein